MTQVHGLQANPIHPEQIPDRVVEEWQSIVDLASSLLDVPAGLIMRLTDPNIEVFVASQSEGNPYHPGNAEHLWGSGLYCETVIRTRDRLLVPNALTDDDWKSNPDVKLNMISYLGMPVLWPDGACFGTICVLDNKENAYSQTASSLIGKLRDLMQDHLELLYMNHALGAQRTRPHEYAEEIQMLRSMVPVCCSCKKIRNDRGYWQAVEEYVGQHTDLDFSHGYCPECEEQLARKIERRLAGQKRT